ncbi:MAG: hypothetical protein ACRC5C_04920 [Bacilli bacterium]
MKNESLRILISPNISNEQIHIKEIDLHLEQGAVYNIDITKENLSALLPYTRKNILMPLDIFTFKQLKNFVNEEDVERQTRQTDDTITSLEPSTTVPTKTEEEVKPEPEVKKAARTRKKSESKQEK